MDIDDNFIKTHIQYVCKRNMTPDIINYLINRYSDNYISYKEIVYRIKNNINEKPKCIICGEYTQFNDKKNHYNITCNCKQCKNMYKHMQTEKACLQKYGVNNVFKLQQIKDKIYQTNLERYGVKNSAQSKEIMEKIQKTCLKKYNHISYLGTPMCKQQTKEQCQKLYNKDHYMQVKEIKDKMQETCLQKYGVKHAMQSKILQDKMRETCLRKYGVKHPSQLNEIKEKVKKTCLEKFNSEYYFKSADYKEKYEKYLLNNNITSNMQLDEVKTKYKETCLKKYGYEYASQSNIVKEKVKNTCIKKYNVDCIFKLPINIAKTHSLECIKKQQETKRKNKTFNKSFIEDNVYTLLVEKFGNQNVKRQYKSIDYPFNCDFYIINKKLYIEYNGSWTHGPHPFNENNIDDINLLNKWKEKSITSDYYKTAIKTWTIRDIIKRNIAIKNKLNYIEFFNINDVKKFLQQIR